jgi:Uma2 family endonuclease
MNLVSPRALAPSIVYPESDGLPMADNSKQFRWIFMLFGNLADQYQDDEKVYVGGNMFWYPKEGEPEVCNAPDVFVVFGRPKGDRASYKQWEENDVPMTVVFEVVSPGNDWDEMEDKTAFYEEHGVEEYYVYNPDKNSLRVYIRQGEVLRRIRPVHGFVSPRLGIRFDMSGPELVVYRADGQPFLSFEESMKRLRAAKQQADQAKQQADQAKQQADQAGLRAQQAEQRAARIVELSRKVRRGQASAEELQELERLEEPAPPSSP